MTAVDDVSAIAVIVPVHDEEELLDACLVSIERAARHARGLRIVVVVVLDACTDGSPSIAAVRDVETVFIEARSVGAARAAGVTAALALLSDVPPAAVWTAHTDADSVVPENWLTQQRELAARGTDVVIGTVHPDFRDLDEDRAQAWRATHVPGTANGHVHGANLGMRLSTLLAAGGFEPIAEHEDVRLVERATSHGARVAASADASVRTSGRTQGRTPGGYARYLREDLVPLAAAGNPGTADG
ncbi:glycosyltransferase [Microbacterium sp. P06]|uniref:glycosyltransferase n=1 Tax=unclassified Microbacterium TaxID=2609290 RepID=UPI003745903E